ncbi:hypothetical protein TA3x_004018 [Tundrisphaera sp. TA3]|uniref:hypothetical protein n=1 Tax=Tundrisphaera sp. TA3 TaxID=3435775 RepID=UPI003EBF64EA
MRRIAILASVCAVLLMSFLPGGATPGHAEPLQKKKRAVLKKDTKDTIDGALWKFRATTREGKEITFKYRATNLTLYDPETGETIGKTENAGKRAAKVTFNDKSKFPGTFTIDMQNPGYYTGTATHDGKSWDLSLRGIDR